jgi:BirA family transcriptional regulator, biotin operon repressor / biotin---[acetyl-CoA-carboxylase] ligase
MSPQKAPVGTPFIELRSIDSTNNYAMRQVHAGVAQHGFSVFAHEQTAGKGQRSKQWLAQPGVNLMLSVVLEPAPRFTTPSFSFGMAMAVAAYGLLKKFTDAVKIKWPNDLFIGDRKAGGILIENILNGSVWRFAIVGIGLNINQTDFGALGNKAVSLKQITGTDYDTILLAKDLCREIDGVLKKLELSPEAIMAAYHQHLYKRGEWVKLRQGSRVFESRIIGVNTAGQLVTQHALEETFDVGAVEWVL